MRNERMKKVIITGLCIAIGLLLPRVINVIPVPYPGAIFLPMHIPVIICGFVCGKYFGTICGAVLPLLAFVLTGMPPIFPTGISMVVELATYGFLSAWLYELTKGRIIISLIIAMVGGRVVMGIANIILFNFTDNIYGISIFISSAFITAFPGIIIQFILIPIIIEALKKASMMTLPNER